jgi:hypothetical protein
MFQEANDTKAAMLINFNYASGEVHHPLFLYWHQLTSDSFRYF